MTNLQTEVSNSIYLEYPEDLNRHSFFDTIKKNNDYDNPKYQLLRKMRKRVRDEPRRLVLWNTINKNGTRYLTLPRGYQDKLNALANKHNITLQWVDNTVYPKLEHPIPEPTGLLDGFQQTALDTLLQHQTGCLQSPTGSGKTNIFLSLIYRLQTPTLIILHTKELLTQTAQRCEQWLQVKPGIIGAGKKELKPITIGMIQTLSRLDLQATKLSNHFGLVIAEEVHHSPSRTYYKVINQLSARYKYGVTATAWRKDQLQFLIWAVVGKIRYKVEHQAVVDAGRTVYPRVETVYTEWDCPVEDAAEWSSIIAWLNRDVDRNRFIERFVRDKVTSDTRALILTDRIRHAQRLRALLKDQHPALLTGDLNDDERKVAMAKVREGCNLTIATVHLLGEGVDVPNWDMLFLVSPFSAGPRVLQALGRVMRASSNKVVATVYDFVDYKVTKLRKAAQGRKSLYEREYGIK